MNKRSATGHPARDDARREDTARALLVESENIRCDLQELTNRYCWGQAGGAIRCRAATGA